MIKKLLTILLLLLQYIYLSAQIAFTAPIAYTTGVPTGAPSAQGSRVRIDLFNNRIYQWNTTGTVWQQMPFGIEEISGTGAPAYTPTAYDSPIVINHKTPNPEIYYYFSGSWHLNGGGGSGSTDLTFSGSSSPFSLNSSTGTGVTLNQGTGIALSRFGNQLTITNAAPDQPVTITAGSGVSITGAYPNFTVANTGDLSPTNELNTAFSVSAGNLMVTDPGSTLTVPVTDIAPVQGITAGTNISVTNTAGNYTINSTASGVTWPLLAPLGTVAAPSYSFASAPESGLNAEGFTLNLHAGPDIPLLIDAASGNGGLTFRTSDRAEDLSIPLMLFQTGNSVSGTGGGLQFQTGDGDSGGTLLYQLGDGNAQAGGGINVFAGNSVTGPGGEVTSNAGSSVDGIGGSFTYSAGASVNGNGGQFGMTSGVSTNGTSGPFLLQAADSPNGNGGYFSAEAGDGFLQGGDYYLKAGISNGDSYVGGSFNQYAGNAPNGYGGPFLMYGGSGRDGGGGMSMFAGNAQNGESGNGGSIFLYGGNVIAPEIGSGGNISIIPGNGDNQAVNGVTIFGGNGIVLPVVTEAQRDNISFPQIGTVIINSTINALQWWSGSNWISL